MYYRRAILAGLFLLLLLPLSVAFSDSDDEEEFDVVEALIFMVAHDNAASGALEVDELNAIKDHVTGYYDQNIFYAKQRNAHNVIPYWESQKQYALDQMNPKIDAAVTAHWAKKRPWIDFVVDFFRPFVKVPENKVPDPDLANTVISGAASGNSIRQGSGGDSTIVNQAQLAAFNAQVQRVSHSSIITSTLIAHDVSVLPSSVAILAETAGNGYLLPSLQSGDRVSVSETSETLNTDDSVLNDQQEETNSSSPGNKPVRFDNLGSTAVIVSVDVYEGSGKESGNASTVVAPEGNSSAYLELPLGEYQFCYEWDTGEDADQDDYTDYRHAITGIFNLTADSPDSPTSAMLVNLNPDTATTRTGKCGQQNISDHTLEERINGEHRYWVSVVETGCDAYEFDTYPKYLSKTLQFDQNYNQVTYGGRVYTQKADHLYQTIRDDGLYIELIPSPEGYIFQAYDDGVSPESADPCVTYTFLLEDE